MNTNEIYLSDYVINFDKMNVDEVKYFFDFSLIECDSTYINKYSTLVDLYVRSLIKAGKLVNIRDEKIDTLLNETSL